MRLFASLRSLVSTLFQRSRIDREIEDELGSHIQHRADDLERSGLPRAEAERRARIEFGGYQRYREESHEALVPSSKLCSRMCASPFASCANLPVSPSLPCSRWRWPSARTPSSSAY
jgi:hypothetical protein